jgi:iron complex outermembrane receptor protein
MFQRTKICSGLLLAFGSTLLAVAPGAFAQDTNVQRVEITGSSIKRVDAETAVPVTVIKADELKKQGVTTVEQIMQSVSAMQIQQTSAQAVGAGTGGGSFADLRGLGANKTLVLLNGRRIANSAFDSSAPDLNTIPFGAIERIEILRDGASALYGTDAISGVINFITRKDYRGGTITVGLDAPQHPGGAAHSANLGFGFGDYDKDGFNFFGFADFNKQAAITSSQRPYYQGQYTRNKTYAPSGTTFPATYLGVDAAGNEVDATPFGGPACLNSANLFHQTGDQANRCREVTSNFIQFVPATQKVSGLMNAAFKINENHKFNLEAFVSQSKVNAQTAPVPYGALYLSPTSPYFPGAGITPAAVGGLNASQNGKPGAPEDGDLFIKMRTVMLGNREDDNTATQGRFSASLEGTLADWDYNIAATLNTNRVTDNLVQGYSDINILATKVTDPTSPIVGGYVLNNAINPFGAQTAAGTALLNKAAAAGKGILQYGSGTVKVVDGHASRELGDWLHAGRAAALALGFEARNENFSQQANPPVAQAVIASTGLDPATFNAGKRDVYAGFFELNVPLIKSLDVTVAARYDKYSDFGNTTNPKVSFRFQPSKAFLLRGSYSTGFRAPSLYELNAAQTYTNSSGGQNDPANTTIVGGVCVPNAGHPQACNNQFEELAGGNTALKPEKSKNATLGIVLEPFSDFTAEFDAYHISFTNQITTLSDSDLFDPAQFATFSKYYHYNSNGDLSTDGTQCPGTNCGYVSAQNQNLGGVKTDGIDTQFNYRLNAGQIGKLTFALMSTWVHSYKYQNLPNGPFIQNVGSWQGAGPVFRWQHNAVIDWNLNQFSLGLAAHYKSGYVDIPNTLNPGYKVSAYTTMDLYGTYAMSKGISLTLGVRNLADSKAPFTYQTQKFQTGYDPRFADPTGRTFYGRATYSF